MMMVAPAMSLEMALVTVKVRVTVIVTVMVMVAIDGDCYGCVAMAMSWRHFGLSWGCIVSILCRAGRWDNLKFLS